MHPRSAFFGNMRNTYLDLDQIAPPERK